MQNNDIKDKEIKELKVKLNEMKLIKIDNIKEQRKKIGLLENQLKNDKLDYEKTIKSNLDK